jgi:hypothetical protein
MNGSLCPLQARLASPGRLLLILLVIILANQPDEPGLSQPS